MVNITSTLLNRNEWDAMRISKRFLSTSLISLQSHWLQLAYHFTTNSPHNILSFSGSKVPISELAAFIIADQNGETYVTGKVYL